MQELDYSKQICRYYPIYVDCDKIVVIKKIEQVVFSKIMLMDKEVSLTVPDYKIFEHKYCQWDNETRSAIIDISNNTKF